MKNQPLKTTAEVRAWFAERGLSVAEWARERGFDRSLTTQIIAGKKACIRGESFQIAVALGMKAGVIDRPLEAARQKKRPTGAKAAEAAARAAATAADSAAA